MACKVCGIEVINPWSDQPLDLCPECKKKKLQIKKYVENLEANEQINSIAEYVKKGLSDAQIVARFKWNGTNLKSDNKEWAEKDIKDIRHAFNLVVETKQDSLFDKFANITKEVIDKTSDSINKSKEEKKRSFDKKNKVSINNFDIYSKYTNARNWKGICELNNVDIDSFGTKKELEALPDHLEEDEVVFALTSGLMSQTETSNSFDFGANTWLVVLTSERFLFLDCAMLTGSIDTQSVRHEHVQAVSSSQGFVLGKIMVDLGSRIIVIDNCQKATVSVIANLANKWLKELQSKKNVIHNSTESNNESPLDMLEKLSSLYSSGVLTKNEFKIAKEKILDKI